MLKKGTIILIVIAVFVLSLLGYVIKKRNLFITLNESINNQWSQVENQLLRRNDLIPNLVNTVKGYAAQEKTIFTNVVEARAKLSGANNIKDKINAANDMTSALSRLLVIVENYPQLKSDANFRSLQDELAGTENRIAVERKRYNDIVREFNTAIKVFPGSMIASLFRGFESKPYFEIPVESKEVPNVQF